MYFLAKATFREKNCRAALSTIRGHNAYEPSRDMLGSSPFTIKTFLLILVIGCAVSLNSITFQTHAASTTPDFTITATSPVSFISGSTAISEIIVNSENGFQSEVNLKFAVFPSTGLSTSLSYSSLIFGSGTSKATFNSTLVGNYTVIITASSGSLSHSTAIAVIVTPVGTPDFEVFTSWDSGEIHAGNSTTNWITVRPENGFVSTVTLTASVSPAGPTTSFDSSAIFDGSGMSVLTIEVGSTVEIGTHTVIVHATSGNLAHSRTIILFVSPFQDIRVTPEVSSLSFNSGTSGTATIMVAPQNGFAGTISFLVISPISCIPSPTSVQSRGSISVTCQSSAPGNYTVSIRITGSLIVHSATIFVHVSAVSPSAPLTIFGLPPSFYGIAAAIIVLVVTGTIFVLRSRRSSVPPA